LLNSDIHFIVTVKLSYPVREQSMESTPEPATQSSSEQGA
jgi:hypothetical protein